MPHTTQCAYGGPGNWSLSTTSARLTVPCGGSDQAMGDDMSSWVRLYFLGMRLLSLNYELVTSMLRSNGWATAYPSADSASAPSEPEEVSLATPEPDEAGAPACASTSMSLLEHATAVATEKRHRNRCRVDRPQTRHFTTSCLALGRWLRRFWGGVARHAPIAPALS